MQTLHHGLRHGGGEVINAIFRPLERWPGQPTKVRRSASFKAKSASRLGLLERELRHLHARGIVIQAYLTPPDIRNDGWPRSGASPSSPGIIISFHNHKCEQFSYPCDTYFDWNDNLYAIALSLESLRAVDRYGVTRNNEQYQGFKRIDAPSRIDPHTLAESFICQHAGVSLADLHSDLNGSYKAAAIKLHPDKVGHDELFKQLQQHLSVLRSVV